MRQAPFWNRYAVIGMAAGVCLAVFLSLVGDELWAREHVIREGPPDGDCD